jgi:2-polyprenyl-3-methyl-5-hydroxy-6-metoxy-1,4-benzoquinol methylase
MKEEEIRPLRVFDEYLRLAQQDAVRFFADVQRLAGFCPACASPGQLAFTKSGFDYELCPRCFTLFVNPRPVAEAFSRYYTDSPSAKYWATTFYKQTAEARRQKLWKPKAQLIHRSLLRYQAAHHSVIDIGGGFGLFAEEMQLLAGQPVTVIEPGPDLANVCREKSLIVIEKFLEQVAIGELPNGPKAFVSFELFEHLHSPAAFLGCLKELMGPGDLFIFTTLSGSGVDIQALWEHSKSVSPPHHLNFLNPTSVAILLEHVGLELLEVTTPGKLDIDILSNCRDDIKDRFWRTFIATASAPVMEQWQNLLAESGFSSHMMVICRAPARSSAITDDS